MLRKVLWIAAACVAVLAALWVSRNLPLDRAAPPPSPAPAPVEAAAPPPEAAPPPVSAPAAPPPPPPPEDVQVQEDAAATGMTTMEPEEAPRDTPPTN